ncbi:hypothetical protein VTO58DRAFT_108269 [Aureobasidium pullulans]
MVRLNRCEPPPEFPLASPYSGIVHHLSGPNSYALTQIHPKTSGSVDGAPLRVPTSMLDSLVRVSRRVAYNHYASILAEARTSVPAGRITPWAITPPPKWRPHSQSLYPAAETDAGLSKLSKPRFPFNNFTCFLTLFPKCFSSFDHSTCALSVSRQYLALEEIYLPFRAAFPNNSTRRRRFT